MSDRFKLRHWLLDSCLKEAEKKTMRSLYIITVVACLSFAASATSNVQGLRAVVEEAGLSVSDSDLEAYIAAGGTVSELREYATMTDEHGRALLNNLTGEECNPNNKHSALGLFKSSRGTPSYLQELSSMTTQAGAPLPCGEVVKAIDVLRSIRNDNATVEFPEISEIQSLMNRVDRHGRPLFDIASAFNMSRLSLDENLQFSQGSGNEDLALVVMGTRDEGGALATQRGRALLSEIGEQYRMQGHIVPTEEDACEAISRYRNIKLLILVGHGVPEGLSFGDLDPAQGRSVMPENYILDPRDEDFKACLDNRLHADARVVLISCSTGGPVADGRENMGQFISRISQRPVTAPFSPIRFDSLRINEFKPFDITMFQFVGDVDATRHFSPAVRSTSSSP